MGGKNPFLGIAYVVVGGLCIVLGALFTATHLIKPRYVPRHACLQAAIQSRVWCSLLTSGGTMTENSATTAISAGTQSSPVGQLQPDAARDMVRERRPLMDALRIHMIIVIVIYQAGVGGVSDSEPGAKNGFLGAQALRIYVCTYVQSRISYPFRTTPLLILGRSISLEYCPRCLSLIPLRRHDRASPPCFPLRVP